MGAVVVVELAIGVRAEEKDLVRSFDRKSEATVSYDVPPQFRPALTGREAHENTIPRGFEVVVILRKRVLGIPQTSAIPQRRSEKLACAEINGVPGELIN